MTSYIEDKYLVHFFNKLAKSERWSEEGDIRTQILDYLKSKTNITLNSDFSCVLDGIDQSSKPVITTLINNLTTGRNGTTIKTKESNTFRDLRRQEIYSKLNLSFASFWLAQDSLKHTIDKYEQSNPYNFYTTENEIEKWKTTAHKKEYYVGPTNNDTIDILTNWDEIKKFSHPLKDIIILDRYCLKSKIRIEHNIIPLIKNLPKDLSAIRNIIFFVKKGEVYENSLQKAHQLIMDKLSALGINSNVIIFEYFKIPHDRCVITNNIFITSGDSLDYFNADGSHKTAGTLISIKPIYEINKSFFENQINKIKEIYQNPNPDFFYGEKSNNMLDLI